jgi:uncharacterized protein YdbL (DUF1318 family)
MTLRTFLLALPTVFAIGCAADPSGREETAEPVSVGTDDLREASAEDTTSPAASARGRDEVVDQARAHQLVGEESSGYLGLVTDAELVAGQPLPGDLEARVSHINIQRRALYTELATKNAVTVNDVAQTTACILLRDKVKIGEAYRTEGAEWKVRVFDVPVATPSFCATK